MAAEILTNLVSGVKISPNYGKPQVTKTDSEFFQKLATNKLPDSIISKTVVDSGESKYDPATIARFQSNTPVAKALNTVKIHNETNKIKSREKKDDDVNGEETDETTETDSEIDENPIGKGYYLVSDNFTETSYKLLPKSKEDEVRNRIETAYDTSKRKKKGSLINLTF